MRKGKILLMMVTMIVCFGWQASVHAAVEWNMATPYPESVFHTVNIEKFINEVEQRTEGEVQINLHPSGSLFKHQEIKRAVRSGQIAMGEVQLSHFSNENELYNFGTLPFMATSFREAMMLWKAARPQIEKALEEQGLRVLYAVPWPPQAFYAREKLNTVDDMNGMKLRTYNKIGSRMARLLGAEPTLVSGAEVPQAFSTGLIEAMVTSSAFGASIQAWDFVSYYHDVRAWLGLNEILINEEAFQKLPSEARKIMLEAAAKAQTRGLRLAKEADVDAKRALEQNGITIVQPSEAFMKEAKARTAKMIDAWVEETGQQAAAIRTRYKELVAQ